MLIFKLIWGLHATIIDFETDFLNRNIQEVIYMKILVDMSQNDNKCLMRNARKFHTRIIALFTSKVHLFAGALKHKKESLYLIENPNMRKSLMQIKT
jgi:hypothetical protein